MIIDRNQISQMRRQAGRSAAIIAPAAGEGASGADDTVADIKRLMAEAQAQMLRWAAMKPCAPPRH